MSYGVVTSLVVVIYTVLKKWLQALRGHNTYMSKNFPVNIHSEINGCSDMGKFCILLVTGVTLQCTPKGQCASYTFIYISLACVVTSSVNSVDTLLIYYWGKSSDNWCCDTHWISNTVELGYNIIKGTLKIVSL
jgi:hypothetical protein